MQYMIQAKNIYKQYGQVEVLKGVSFEVGEGEVVSIVGASGAGKTTLLQILGTLDKPTQAKKNKTELWIGGKEITTLKDAALSQFRNQNIGFIFQFHQLLPEFTALENVCMPSFIAGKSKAKVAARAKELLSFFGLNHRAEHKPAQLSGGEQQRIAVARSLMNQPRVIFADEPSGNLDSKNATELHQLFFDLRAEFNQTFVLVTHNETLADMADRKLVMSDGNLCL